MIELQNGLLTIRRPIKEHIYIFTGCHQRHEKTAEWAFEFAILCFAPLVYYRFYSVEARVYYVHQICLFMNNRLWGMFTDASMETARR